MVAMGNPVGPCASNERNHLAGHALHSTAALAGSLHAFNSFSLAGPSWKFIKPDWNAIIFCISHLSFFHFLLLRFLLQKCFRYCHCECKWWIILSMERVRARLMNLWNTISVNVVPTSVTVCMHIVRMMKDISAIGGYSGLCCSVCYSLWVE